MTFFSDEQNEKSERKPVKGIDAYKEAQKFLAITIPAASKFKKDYEQNDSDSIAAISCKSGKHDDHTYVIITPASNVFQEYLRIFFKNKNI